jgi:hypothetical protein
MNLKAVKNNQLKKRKKNLLSQVNYSGNLRMIYVLLMLSLNQRGDLALFWLYSLEKQESSRMYTGIPALCYRDSYFSLWSII